MPPPQPQQQQQQQWRHQSVSNTNTKTRATKGIIPIRHHTGDGRRYGRKIRPIVVVVLFLILIVVLRLFSHLRAPVSSLSSSSSIASLVIGTQLLLLKQYLHIFFRYSLLLAPSITSLLNYNEAAPTRGRRKSTQKRRSVE